MVLCKLSPLLLIMVSVLWKLILIPLLFSWNLNLGIYLFEVSILDLLMSFMDSAPMPLEGSVAPSSPGSSQMADQAGPSNAGLAHSPAGSFPSVPSGLSPIPDDPSIPSVPSLPSLDSHDGEQSVEQRAPRESHPNPVASPGEDAGPSNRLLLDLNLPPSPSPEPGPEPAPPAPLSAEEEALRTKRERVRSELMFLLQLGFSKKARPFKIGEGLLQWLEIENERDEAFLNNLHAHLSELSDRLGARVDRPSQKLSDKEMEALQIWVLNEKDKGLGEGER